MNTENSDRLDSILGELRKLNKLVGILLTQDKSASGKITLLGQAGLSPKEISETLGISANLASATLYQERKKNTRKRK
jgi:hypothetical protein